MSRPKYTFILFWLILLLAMAGCIRVSSDSDPVQTPAAPPEEEDRNSAADTDTADTPAPTASAAPTEPAPTETNTVTPPPAVTADNAIQPAVRSAEFRELTAETTFTLEGEIAELHTISLDGGPLPDLLVQLQSGAVLAADLTGNEYWRPEAVSINSIAAADLNLNRAGDLILGTEGGAVSVLEGNVLRWSHSAPGPVTSLSVIPGMTPPQTALIAGTANGYFWGMDADNNRTWIESIGESSIKEIIPLSTGELILLQANGALTWVTSRGETVWTSTIGTDSAVAAGDFNGDGRPQIAVLQENTILISDESGVVTGEWEADAPLHTMTVVDDALYVGGAADGIVARLNKTGEPLWLVSVSSPAEPPTGITVMKQVVDPAERPLLAIGLENGRILLLNDAGEIVAAGELGTAVSGLRQMQLQPGPAGVLPQIIVWTGAQGAVFPLPGAANAAADPAPDAAAGVPVAASDQDLPAYSLDVTLDYFENRATVSQQITVTNTTGEMWPDIVLHVATAYWNGIFVPEGTAVLRDDARIDITPEWNNTMMRLPLDTPLSAGETIVIALDYTLSLPRLDPLGWAPIGNAGWAPGVIQMGDWYPALVPYEPGLGWRTWQFTPVGDPVISRLGNYDVRINAPPDLLIAAPGYVRQEGSSRFYRMENARAFAFLASPSYIRFEGDARGVPVQVFITSDYQQVGPTVLQTVINALNLFVDLYGPYPYPEFVIAENGYLTAMEYSGIVSLSGFAFDSYNNRADSLLIAIIAHEVAHQWWYGSVGNDQVNEPWLDESLAMFSELLYYEQFHPDLLDWWWQFRVDRWNPTGAVDVSIYDYPTSESFVHNMYGQAAYFMRDLRAQMGEQNFRSFVRDYYRLNQFQFADRTDFFNAAQSAAAVDLTPLFEQYFQE